MCKNKKKKDKECKCKCVIEKRKKKKKNQLIRYFLDQKNILMITVSH